MDYFYQPPIFLIKLWYVDVSLYNLDGSRLIHCPEIDHRTSSLLLPSGGQNIQLAVEVISNPQHCGIFPMLRS